MCGRFELADFTVHLQCSLIINEQLLIRLFPDRTCGISVMMEISV